TFHSRLARALRKQCAKCASASTRARTVARKRPLPVSVHTRTHGWRSRVPLLFFTPRIRVACPRTSILGCR
ncbi:hypothetical protein HN873_051709, partial [Arachis hypogaea]